MSRDAHGAIGNKWSKVAGMIRNKSRNPHFARHTTKLYGGSKADTFTVMTKEPEVAQLRKKKNKTTKEKKSIVMVAWDQQNFSLRLSY